MSTSPSDSKENGGGGGESGSGTEDKLSNINAEIDRVTKEIDSLTLTESFAQSTNEFEAIQERWKHLKADELGAVEREKEFGLMRASVVQSSEILDAKLERLHHLMFVRDDTRIRIELEKLLIRSKASREKLEQVMSQLLSQYRISNKVCSPQ